MPEIRKYELWVVIAKLTNTQKQKHLKYNKYAKKYIKWDKYNELYIINVYQVSEVNYKVFFLSLVVIMTRVYFSTLLLLWTHLSSVYYSDCILN